MQLVNFNVFSFMFQFVYETYYDKEAGEGIRFYDPVCTALLLYLKLIA
jgi:inosine-uridine nucleoside N-ribohydrolase